MANTSENATFNSTLDNQKPSPILTAVLYGYSTLTVLINIPTALILIVSLIRKTKIRNVHLLSLGITDCLLGISCFPIVNTHGKTSVSFTDCLMRWFFIHTAYMASNAHIFVICLERVCLVCFKTIAAKMKANRKVASVLTITSSWTFAFFVVSVDYSVRARDSKEKTCSFNRVLPSGHPVTGLLLAGLQTGILTSMVILTTYLVNHTRQMRINNIRKVSKNEIRRSLTVCIIIIACTGFNIPLITVLLYGRYVEIPPRLVYNAAFLVAGFNSFANPIIYIFRIREYRKILYDVLFKLYCCKNKVAPAAASVPP